MKLRYSLALIVALISSLSQAQTPLVIPNTFTNGEIIDADNINQNFTEIETHVNTNQGGKHFYLVDANNVVLGRKYGTDVSLGSSNSQIFVTDEGYISEATSLTYDQFGGSLNFYFPTSDCSGETIWIDGPYNNIIFPRIVFTPIWTSTLYYLASFTTESVTYNSTIRGYPVSGVAIPCAIQTGTRLVYPISKNDPIITGVPDSILLPVRIEYR